MWSKWLTYKQLKVYLDVSVPTVNKWIVTLGFPKPFPVGGTKVYFDKEQVDKWMKSRRRACKEG